MIPRAIILVVLGLLVGGCVTATPEAAPEANLKPRDREYLANAPYEKVVLPYSHQRALVDYHRREAPGTIVVDTDSRHLYFVLANQKAIRYGVAVGEEALAFSGVAKVGAMTEWPAWTPTANIKRRFPDLPNHVEGGPKNPLGARALYLHANGKDTLFRIHGTNQPGWIGSAISSGCIRMTNEDVIDLYSRTRMGATVVVLHPGAGMGSFFTQQAALTERN
jgi:lipoprotein-anchoring transpeptidase ErfK/SrfK